MIPVVKVSGKGRSYNASSKLLKLCKGDSVKFHWAGGLPHDVVTVAAAAWSTCGLAGKKGVAALGVSGSKTVKYAAGSKTYSYLCSVPGHCSAGQKLRVSVSSKC
jgi:plastocyanin